MEISGLVERFRALNKSDLRPQKPVSRTDYDMTIMSNTVDLDKLVVGFEYVDSEEQLSLYNYMRARISSMVQHDAPGSLLKILVKDLCSGRYLGMLQFSRDCLQTQCKNEYIMGQPTLTARQKNRLKTTSVNISLCVPVQPFGYNYCGGKLLAMLAFSAEIQAELHRRHPDLCVGVIYTTSIHGTSIQYDRLRELKLVGYTQGYGTSHVPKSLIEDCREYLLGKYDKKSAVHGMSHFTILKRTLQELGLDAEILHHGQKRGIYVGWTGNLPHVRAYLKEERDDFSKTLLGTEEITKHWVERWARRRYVNVLAKMAM